MKDAAALIAIAALLCCSPGCSSESDPPTAPGADQGEVEEGGVVENPHRDQARNLLSTLADAATAEEERLATDALADWLNTHSYKLQIETTDSDAHRLFCPHFPPVTPWVEHTFLDPTNLDRLPKHDSE